MISIKLSKRFKKIVRETGRENEVIAALNLIKEGFGNPHAHSGLSIRKLGRDLYECRTSLAWRLVFQASKGELLFDFAGDHNEVQSYLRGRR
jgi:mRNA-degrading endonuclease YafQ of YafQ-DinJ toxin-antitoxin module